jgi:hypothetical protein
MEALTSVDILHTALLEDGTELARGKRLALK